MSSFTPYIKVVPSTDGVSIYADAIGDSTKPSIVFIHGFGVSGACFDNLFADKNLLAHFYLVSLVSYYVLIPDNSPSGAIRLAWARKKWKTHYCRRLHVPSFRQRFRRCDQGLFSREARHGRLVRTLKIHISGDDSYLLYVPSRSYGGTLNPFHSKATQLSPCPTL